MAQLAPTLTKFGDGGFVGHWAGRPSPWLGSTSPVVGEAPHLGTVRLAFASDS